MLVSITSNQLIKIPWLMGVARVCDSYILILVNSDAVLTTMTFHRRVVGQNVGSTEVGCSIRNDCRWS